MARNKGRLSCEKAGRLGVAFNNFVWISKVCCFAGQMLAQKTLHSVSANHAYMSSHSPSSSSSLGGGGGGGGAFSLTRSLLSSGHVACSFSQGAIHSKSNMWFLLHGRRTTRGYSSGRIVLAGGNRWWDMMESDSPSRKELLQIGQSIAGFRSLFGTRSSSADVVWVSYGSGERCVRTRCSSRDAHSSHPSSKRRNSPNLPETGVGKPFSTHRPETPD